MTFCSFDKAEKSLSKRESDDLVLFMVSETICISTKEKKKSVSFLDSIEEHEFEILPSIHVTGVMFYH